MLFAKIHFLVLAELEAKKKKKFPTAKAKKAILHRRRSSQQQQQGRTSTSFVTAYACNKEVTGRLTCIGACARACARVCVCAHVHVQAYMCMRASAHKFVRALA